MKKSINRTQYKLINDMYNQNLYSVKLSNKKDIEQALALQEKYPNDFTCESESRYTINFSATYVFTIKDLGSMLELLKYNSKYEVL